MSKDTKVNKAVAGDEQQVTYVEFGDQYCSQVIAHLPTDGLAVTDLYPLADALREALVDHASSVEPVLRRDGVTLVASLKPGGHYGDNYMPEGRKDAILAILQPTFTRRVAAQAHVVRRAGKHVETRVTATLQAGELFKGLKANQYNGHDGVLRARVTSDTRQLVFAMSEPASNDDDGVITAVTEALTGKISALLVKPVTVIDDDPDAGLNPDNDYAPPSSKS